MGKSVYIDESGDESFQLSLPNVSSFYVVCAIVVDPEHLTSVSRRFEEVRARYFKHGEMKSDAITNHVKRLAILQDLAGVEFALHLLIGNKQYITSPGLQYPKSFIKYLHSAIYKEVAKDHPGVSIRADRIKNPAFMREMRAYLERNDLISLFEVNSFDFVDSRDEVCIQAADFIGGSVRACFERNPRTAMTNDIMEKLRPRVATFLPFPDRYGDYIAKVPGAGVHDHAIESRAIMEAEQFLRTRAGSPLVEDELQMAVVRELLSALAWSDSTWVSTEKLMDRLRDLDPDISEQSFRGVIGKLRDARVLIASRVSGGYKLPTRLADMVEFLNRQNSQLAPMLNRVRCARETISRATNGTVDILAMYEFQNLKAALDAVPLWYAQGPVIDPMEEGTVAREVITAPGLTIEIRASA